MATTDDNINDNNDNEDSTRRVVRGDVLTTTTTDDVKNTPQTELSSEMDGFERTTSYENNNNNNDKNGCTTITTNTAPTTSSHDHNNQNERTTLIRLPSTYNYADELNDIETPEQVWKKINETRQFQSRYRPSELYNRTWNERVTVATTNESSTSSSGTRATFTVLQYNMLAEGLCSGPDETPPFSITPSPKQQQQQLKNCYGGFTNIPHPTICLPFTHRKWRLLESLLSSLPSSSSHPDLMALEEIDHYHDFFHPLLTSVYDYDGIFHPKPHAPGVNLGYYSDGCALFWKKDTFSLINSKKGRFRSRMGELTSSQVYILATLRHVATGDEILVAVTHLKARQGWMNEELRSRQVEELLSVVEEVRDGREVIIMGDFNSDVMDEGGSRCVRRLLDEEEEEERRLSMSSAYPLASKSLFTTWKTRGNVTTRRMIDYIFFSSQLRCTKILSLPTDDEVDQPELLPGFRSPSDHLNIAATFEIGGE